MGIKFRTDPKLAIANVRQLRKRLIKGRELAEKIAAIHEKIKAIIVLKLRDDTFSTRDPRATNRGFGFDVNKIIAAIDNGVLIKRMTIIGGTGRISALDSRDPLLTAKPARTLGPTQRLWRILEYGAKRHPILAKNLSVSPKDSIRKAIKGSRVNKSAELSSRGSSKRRTTGVNQVPQLRFFWKLKNVPFRGPVVDHPGQLGRGIWRAVARSEARALYRTGIDQAIRALFRQHSGRSSSKKG